MLVRVSELCQACAPASLGVTFQLWIFQLAHSCSSSCCPPGDATHITPTVLFCDAQQHHRTVLKVLCVVLCWYCPSCTV